jgi:hypothetical protein
MVDVTNQAKNIRAGNHQNDVYFVFEDLPGRNVKLSKITRSQLDNLVNTNQQLQLVTNATTILPKGAAGYGNGTIQGMDLFIDQVTGFVRLTVAIGGGQTYIGRIETGNWVSCPNSPFALNGTLKEVFHANGNANVINAFTSAGGNVYVEGH